MATEVLGRLPVRSVNRKRERVFFCCMTLLMIATILLGFRKTYFPLGAKPPALSSWVIQIHGVLFSLYLLLLLTQTALIAARRVRWHMSLGLAVYGLAGLMIPMGVMAAADELRRDLAGGPPYPNGGIDPRTFSLVSVTGMVMFGTLITWSYVARRQPDAHKRLVLYATLSMMDAGVDRWPLVAMGMNQSWATWIYTALLLLPVAYDLISLRRIHWVTMFAAPFAFLLHRLEYPLGNTHAWHAAANFILRFLR